MIIEENEMPMLVLQRIKLFIRYHWPGLILFFTPILCLPLLFIQPTLAYRCAYILAVMTIYWVTEAIPIYVTSLIPIVAFPLAGIMDSELVCMSYFKDSMWLFFGSLIVALAIEKSNLHKRIALNVILCIGCSPRRLHFSLVIVTTFISMWISNSAATTMMCPVIKATLEELASQNMLQLSNGKINSEGAALPSKTVLCYYLGIAYASSIGGFTTLIGTGTNIVFKGIYESSSKDNEDLDFLRFLLFALPLMFVLTLFSFAWLQWLYMGLFRPRSAAGKEIVEAKKCAEVTKSLIQEKRAELGPLTMHEIQVAFLFVLMVLLIITRKPGIFRGWADFIGDKNVKNSMPVFFICLLLFILPVNYAFIKFWNMQKSTFAKPLLTLIRWEQVQRDNPWGLLFLTGGSLALAEGIHASGFSTVVSNSLTCLTAMPAPLLQFLCILMAILLTGVSANIAICNIMIPVLLEMSKSMGMHPLYLTLPTCIALSIAFQLPVSTAPNAIVAALANIRTIDMLIASIGPSICGLLGIFILSQTWAHIIFPNFGSISAAAVVATTNATALKP